MGLEGTGFGKTGPGEADSTEISALEGLAKRERYILLSNKFFPKEEKKIFSFLSRWKKEIKRLDKNIISNGVIFKCILNSRKIWRKKSNFGRCLTDVSFEIKLTLMEIYWKISHPQCRTYID